MRALSCQSRQQVANSPCSKTYDPNNLPAKWRRSIQGVAEQENRMRCVTLERTLCDHHQYLYFYLFIFRRYGLTCESPFWPHLPMSTTQSVKFSPGTHYLARIAQKLPVSFESLQTTVLNIEAICALNTRASNSV